MYLDNDLVSSRHVSLLCCMAIYCKLYLQQLICCARLKEGAAILCGIAYNGRDSNGDDKWDGVRDLHIWGWEFGYDFQSVIESFNVGTNTFAKKFVYSSFNHY